MNAPGNPSDALLLPLVPNPASWPSDALLDAAMRACVAPPSRSGILRPPPAAPPAGGGVARSFSC
jgi:hypothetical protein